MSREIGGYFDAMSANVRASLASYYTQLEDQLTDKHKLAAAERALREREEMRAQHAQTQRTTALLQTAYEEKRAKNRAQHSERLAKRTAAKTRPESAPRRQTAARPRAQPAASPSAP